MVSGPMCFCCHLVVGNVLDHLQYCKINNIKVLFSVFNESEIESWQQQMITKTNRRKRGEENETRRVKEEEGGREFIMQVADIISWTLDRFACFHKREVAVCMCVGACVCVKEGHSRRVKSFKWTQLKSFIRQFEVSNT